MPVATHVNCRCCCLLSIYSYTFVSRKREWHWWMPRSLLSFVLDCQVHYRTVLMTTISSKTSSFAAGSVSTKLLFICLFFYSPRNFFFPLRAERKSLKTSRTVLWGPRRRCHRRLSPINTFKTFSWTYQSPKKNKSFVNLKWKALKAAWMNEWMNGNECKPKL